MSEKKSDFKRRNLNSNTAAEVRQAIEKPEPVVQGKGPYELVHSYTAADLLSSGCTLLNLACSDMIEGAYYLGGMVNLIGDSGIGKSLSALTAFAEAVRDKRFDKYSLVDYEPERRMLFDLERIFGQGMARVQFPLAEKNAPTTIQEWHNDRLQWYLKEKKRLIDITDSWDALTTDDDMKVDDKKLGKGGWKTEKAIVGSATFPKIIGLVEKSRSVMMILSQTRQNLGAGLFGPDKKRSGGEALTFYAVHEIWLYYSGKITQTLRGKKEEIGTFVTAKIGKNSLTGKRRSVRFRVLDQYGIDDITSMVEWLVDKKFWGTEKKKKDDEDNDSGESGNVIDTCGDFINGKLETIVGHIEKNNYENDLRQIVGRCWAELESELAPKRKPKYA